MSNGESGKSALGLDANMVALLCYIANICMSLGLILSIITVVTDKTNKLARFHAFQSILLSVFGAIFGIVVAVLVSIGAIIDTQIGVPVITGLTGLVAAVIGLGLLIGIIMAAVKGYQGQIYKLPIVGNMADKYSG
jgi:uncharacterized membrane protein